jgi:hypothetical protein
VDAADSKGEPIHQTLMAKKMQRLDESPDFRPFKFRIAAFTNAFLEEVDAMPASRLYAAQTYSAACQAELPRRDDTHEKGVNYKTENVFRNTDIILDPKLPMETSLYPTVQRGRKKGQI